MFFFYIGLQIVPRPVAAHRFVTIASWLLSCGAVGLTFQFWFQFSKLLTSSTFIFRLYYLLLGFTFALCTFKLK